ncbi:MAG: polyhydroxyalkanoate synthesis repressor PhaR [Flavobacteriaceae bacterium]
MSAKQPTIIKKYANRRLYNTGTSAYVTLDDLAEMVQAGEEFEVVDAKSGEDLTRGVLSQIIFEQESKGGSLMPVTFLRQMIKFYGDSMQALVPAYLDMSLKKFAGEQEKFREQISRTFGASAAGAMEEQVRQNMQMFEKAYQMFSPFAKMGGDRKEEASGTARAPEGSRETAGELETLRRQMAEMQSQIEKLAGKKS